MPFTDGMIIDRAHYDQLRAEVERLRAALQGLIDGVIPEVNEKGAGGYLLARLQDAREALNGTTQSSQASDPSLA